MEEALHIHMTRLVLPTDDGPTLAHHTLVLDQVCDCDAGLASHRRPPVVRSLDRAMSPMLTSTDSKPPVQLPGHAPKCSNCATWHRTRARGSEAC